MNELTIGGLAKAAGVGVETVRYYQRRRLIPEPPRSYGTIRRYRAADVERLRFIKAAQELGFSLKEVVELLGLDQGGSCRAVERIAQSKLTIVRTRIAGLKQIERTLAALVSQCKTTRGRLRCPIIKSLHADSSFAPK